MWKSHKSWVPWGEVTLDIEIYTSSLYVSHISYLYSILMTLLAPFLCAPWLLSSSKCVVMFSKKAFISTTVKNKGFNHWFSAKLIHKANWQMNSSQDWAFIEFLCASYKLDKHHFTLSLHLFKYLLIPVFQVLFFVCASI